MFARKRGKLDEAVALLSRAAAERDDARDHNALGIAHLQRRDHAAAAKAFERALAIHPAHVEARFNLAMVLEEIGDWRAAVASYRKLPQVARAQYNLGCLLQSHGEEEGAADAYRAAIAVSPNMAVALCNLGVVSREPAYLEAAIEIEPDMVIAWSNLARLHKEAGDASRALQCYRKVLAINPDHATARHMVSALTKQNPDRAPSKYVSELSTLTRRPSTRSSPASSTTRSPRSSPSTSAIARSYAGSISVAAPA